jgi:hypothetical protein
MRDINEAIKYLDSKGIDSHETAGILEIPVDSPEEIVDMVSIVKHHLQDIGYDKSWQINPYYYKDKESLTHDMYG